MTRKQIIILIEKLVSKKLTFDDYSKEIEKELSGLSLDQIKESLLECGVIPESFGHDSTEEKLYSKYTDILLAKAFNFLGIKSIVVRQRSDSADVEGATTTYSIVADAKAFRLSRTAKNQKDFKVEALNKWRGTKDFACLVCPLYQYPSNTSQIYRQAINRNVTLLAYIHLVYLLSQKFPEKVDYNPLWLAGKRLKGAKDAIRYWKAIDTAICKITRKPLKDLQKFKDVEIKAMQKGAKEEIACIEGKIQSIKKLSHTEAITRLVKSEKLDSKIKQIKKISGLK
jgi:type II restriction enzyme